eukprot:Rmarinus@m.10829
MGKKKPFNRKEALRFQLVHRSPADPLSEDPEASINVLKPIQNPNVKSRDDPHRGVKLSGPDFDYGDHLKNPRMPTYSDDDEYFTDDEGDEGDSDAEGQFADATSKPGASAITGSDGQFSDASDEESQLRDKKASAPHMSILHRTVQAIDNDRYANSNFGFPEDGYDYSQHLKEIDERRFMSVESLSVGLNALPSPAAPFALKTEARGTKKKSDDVSSASGPIVHGDIDPTIDAELLAALQSDDEGSADEFDEGLDDNFIAQANASERFVQFDGESPDQARERAAAIAAIREAARRDRMKEGFEDMETLLEKDREAGNQSHLDEHFAHFAQSYGDENIGQVDDDDPELCAKGDIADFDYLVSEYMTTGEVVVQKRGKVALSKLDERRGDEPPQLEIKERVISLVERQEKEYEENGSESEDDGASDEEKEKWDCETIVTTYSNLENHPSVLSLSKNKIRLSNKSGLAVDYLPEKGKGGIMAPVPEDSACEVNEGNGVSNGHDGESDSDDGGDGDEDNADMASIMSVPGFRPKNETAEEKRARKKLLKEERRSRRENKKNMKLAFKAEEAKQKKKASSNNGVKIVPHF